MHISLKCRHFIVKPPTVVWWESKSYYVTTSRLGYMRVSGNGMIWSSMTCAFDIHIIFDDYCDDLLTMCLPLSLSMLCYYTCSTSVTKTTSPWRKCHNFCLLCLSLLFRIRKYFLHDRNISCDKIISIMQQSGIFLLSFPSIFARYVLNSHTYKFGRNSLWLALIKKKFKLFNF